VGNDLRARVQTLARLRRGRIGVSDRWDSSGGTARDNYLTGAPYSRLRSGSGGTDSVRALSSLETGSDILHTPNFQRDHREAERPGRCLNLTHIQQGDRIAGIGQNR
jgi:hypothetical protein